MLNLEQKHSLAHPIFGGLKTLGYRRGLVQRDYKFVDLFSPTGEIQDIDIAAFGQEPFDYRSCCIAVKLVSSLVHSEQEVRQVRALGAPHVFVVTPQQTQRWLVGEKSVVQAETFPTGEIERRISDRLPDWNPATLLRVKAGFEKQPPTQVDMVDVGLLAALESEAGKKIDQMVSRVLHTVEGESLRRGVAFDPHLIFNVLFRFLAAKLLRDRDYRTEPAIDFSDPIKTLLAVDNHYRSHGKGKGKLDISVLRTIAEETAKSFSFRNISVDTLTYVYENTFVSPQSRKSLGIHSTPSYVADYVLSRIPIEEIPRERWHFLDATCGHGIFLIAAMRRMRQLLPSDWGSQKRHQFFIEHLAGIDVEQFSIEVARLCLMLADFPEPNGWNLQCRDVFSKGVLEEAVSKSQIIVGNPPFEILKNVNPAKPAPAELLDRTLGRLATDGFVGLVLPKAFLDSVDYSKQREALLRGFDVLTVTALPDRIFIHSDAETTIVVARKRNKIDGPVYATYSEVKDRDRAEFVARQTPSWEDQVPQSFFADKGVLSVPELRLLWDALSANPRLGGIAEIKKGVEYDTSKLDGKYSNAIFAQKRPNTAAGVHQSTEALSQYVLSQPEYLSLDQSLRRRDAWNYDWAAPKVIAPAARLSRGPWRFAAVVDRKGLLASRLHYAFWPTDPEIPVEVIAAIMNSPLGAAYAYCHGTQKTVAKRTYQAIPLPPMSVLREASTKIQRMVEEYVAVIEAPLLQSNARDLLLAIDAEVLGLYKLPPQMERKLLDLFWNEKRRVPFEFQGYFPPEKESWIPLSMTLSKGYGNASAASIMKRLPKNLDAETLALLKNFGREEDE
ncbi:MAG: N-6 DNA methylase [Polaromonas sp.]|nr:N-6 DNA methylase [Polaromonas sp.]MDP3752604.1 N-6 DNA methylase [Polaromonas sp.]